MKRNLIPNFTSATRIFRQRETLSLDSRELKF